MARFGKLGWFLGLIFGTIFGVLFAPRKGKELRAKMKADRKKGRLGISPLKEDMFSLGQELAELAREVYEFSPIKDIVEHGRKHVKEISDDIVEEVADFHVTRIAPFGRHAKARLHEGKKALKKAKHKFHALKHKVDSSAKIGKRAFKDVKRVFKKKSS